MAPVSSRLSAIADATTEAVATRASGFDAIVIGGGASGGLAARLLCEAGMDVLLLDAGWCPPFLNDPLRQATAASIVRLANPRALGFLHPRLIRTGRQSLKALGRRRQPIQSACYAWERAPSAFVDDFDNPYELDFVRF